MRAFNESFCTNLYKLYSQCQVFQSALRGPVTPWPASFKQISFHIPSRPSLHFDIRGISKSIRHFIRHFIRHSTILCVTQPSHASLNHLMCHSTILTVTQQFCQDVDFINKFDTIWSSKWLWSIIFFSESGYLDDRTFQHMHVTVKALNDLHVFAHWRYMDLLVWLLCICQTQQSAFADKWYQRFVWNIAGFLPKQFVYFPTPIIKYYLRILTPKTVTPSSCP